MELLGLHKVIDTRSLHNSRFFTISQLVGFISIQMSSETSVRIEHKSISLDLLVNKRIVISDVELCSLTHKFSLVISFMFCCAKKHYFLFQA